MSAPRKKRPRSNVLLPWERRNAWLAELLGGKRWRSVLLLGAAAAGVYGAWGHADHRARLRTTRAGIAEVQRAVTAFRAELGRCPRSTIELVHPPKAGASYLNEIPNDGWGRALYVRCPDRDDPDSARVISAGPSGSFSKDDNIL